MLWPAPTQTVCKSRVKLPQNKKRKSTVNATRKKPLVVIHYQHRDRLNVGGEKERTRRKVDTFTECMSVTEDSRKEQKKSKWRNNHPSTSYAEETELKKRREKKYKKQQVNEIQEYFSCSRVLFFIVRRPFVSFAQRFSTPTIVEEYKHSPSKRGNIEQWEHQKNSRKPVIA